MTAIDVEIPDATLAATVHEATLLFAMRPHNSWIIGDAMTRAISTTVDPIMLLYSDGFDLAAYSISLPTRPLISTDIHISPSGTPIIVPITVRTGREPNIRLAAPSGRWAVGERSLPT